jgi:transposase-like protein
MRFRFKWTSQKRRAARLLGRGHNKVETARIVGTHRNVIHRWLDDLDFAMRVADERSDNELSINLRRLRTVTAFTDAVETSTARALKSAVLEPGDVDARKRAAVHLKTFRKQLAQERRELADLETARSPQKASRRFTGRK